MRARVAANHTEAKALAGTDYNPARATQYNGLKLAGLQKAPVHIAVFADVQTSTGHGLGRKSMPETVVWSAMMAIHTLWLAATAQGLGLGWVSILDPSAVTAILDVPTDWTFLAYLCVGWPEEYPERPLLETQQWERQKNFDSVVFTR